MARIDLATENLIEMYGPRLERISALDKVHLLSVLALYQAQDTMYESDPEYYAEWTLLETATIYPCELSEEFEELINCVAGCSDQAMFDLMQTLANQLAAVKH